ncbi:TetR/AcrR family transcriptional regulator [Actinocatenispora sera]|uniref:TetR family transcriptional regulator n=1 Tax=Actinocatenispora sera TaxID=390989 RepID=A0A810L8C7_9ACTN|nr:TetR/AcrR family transcriptional regulator [Actinocatenispora sera]BCJ31784.1 TetR family transcriptional regulator [Actinocatenispora sera]
MPVPRGTTLDPSRTRDAIVSTATGLLYQRGLDGIGVAELCRELGVSKETLYRHFGSKDGLIQAVLERRSDRVVQWLAEVVADAGDDPARQLAALFDALGRWYGEPRFRGCAVLNAASQHHADPVRPIAARHLDRYLSLLTGIATRAGAADPAALGRQLLMLVEGATVCADHADADGRTAQLARAAALKLLRDG